MKEEVKTLLLNEGFDVVDYSDVKSSVDLIAKRGRDIYVLRLLGNLDALKPEHAHDMLNLARILKGTALVISERSRWGELKDGVIYYRHGVPAVNLSTFCEMVKGELPKAVYVKGKEIVELDTERLRKRREEMGLSLQKLAELIGTTKETIYRYEHGYYASVEMAKKLEKVIGEDLRKGIQPVHGETSKLLHYPFNVLESLGAEVGEFRRLPWEAMGRRRFIISFIRETEPRILKRRILEIRKAKGKVLNYFLLIGRRRKNIPYIEEEEILEARNFREIEKIARERNEE